MKLRNNIPPVVFSFCLFDEAGAGGPGDFDCYTSWVMVTWEALKYMLSRE